MTKTKKKNELEPALLKIFRDPSRFEKLTDGWIRDKVCGVEWGPSSTERMDFRQAKEYCADHGGRLPEVNELQSLVDYRHGNPAVDKTLFPDTQSNYYWSNTVVAGYSFNAWCVSFRYGSVYGSHKGDGNYVRPVRDIPRKELGDE